jgi:hypothetical protein
VTLKTFLAETDRTAADLYRGADRSWTRLRRDAGLRVDAGDAHEQGLLRAMYRLQHLDDLERVAFYRRLLASERPPSEIVDDRERRLVTMLALALFGRRHGLKSLDHALTALWRNPSVRQELLELLDVLDDASETAERPLGILPGVPLAVHARYTRDEALAALGDGSFERPPTSREGVRWLSDIRTDVFFVTLRKSERRYSPSTRYRDYAISPHLFHWESQSTTSADSPTGRRYRRQVEDGTNVLLFVRENPTLPSGAGAPFTLLGPASLVEHRGERPMRINWRLRDPMPESLLEVARLVAA